MNDSGDRRSKAPGAEEALARESKRWELDWKRKREKPSGWKEKYL